MKTACPVCEGGTAQTYAGYFGKDMNDAWCAACGWAGKAWETQIEETPMSEQEIEKRIQEKGLNAPRLTPADIDAVIVSETFTVLPSGKAMVCELTLASGFTVRGESACVSKENFDHEIGQKISKADARNKVWQLEGYRLQCDLARSK